jgi:hypothetical protein
MPEQGAISRGIDWLLGDHWRAKVVSACGYVQMIVGALAGGTLLSATQIDSLGVPWLAHHWLAIVGWSTILNGILSLVSKRVTPPTVQPPFSNR